MIPDLQDLSVDILFHFIVQIFPLEEEKKKNSQSDAPSVPRGKQETNRADEQGKKNWSWRREKRFDFKIF